MGSDDAVKLTRADLWSLEDYAVERPQFRREILEHKRSRQLPVGPNVTLYFEDRHTIKYQVQEMLRAERIFEPDAIADELAAYNPLIPDGDNWKATMMIEFADREERVSALERLVGIESRCWVQVAGFDRVYAIADEDMPRATQVKTSAVHFLRFPLPQPACRALVEQGAAISAGVDHNAYRMAVDPLPQTVADSLRQDIQA